MTEADTRDRMSLRAHHLLCLHGFRGLGYDDRFVENMARICERIRADLAPDIVVIDEPDEICDCCPHVRGSICEKDGMDAETRAKELDHRVMRHLGIEAGQALPCDRLMNLIYEKIAPEDLAILCESCTWLPFDYCAEGLRKKEIGK